MAGVPDYIIKYGADLSDVQAQLSQLETLNRRMAQTLGGNFQQAMRIVGTGVDDVRSSIVQIGSERTGFINVTQDVQNLGKVVQLADGSFKQYTETNTYLQGQLVDSKSKLSDMTGQFVKTNIETEKGQKNFLTMGENIKRLGERALLTIPVWLALRGAIMGLIRSFQDGFKNMIEFDKQLQRLKKNFQGTGEEISIQFDKAKEAIVKFSVESGVGVEKITRAIQRFATVGFDFETAMKAGIDATKLSVVLFGDAENTANAFSRGLRTLVTDIHNVALTQQEITEAFALTSKLYETNAFELNELSDGLEKFSGTAKSMGFSIQETITLLSALSTRGLNAGRAGTLLRTSTQKLQENLSNLASVLGIEVNPEVDRTFDLFIKTINAISELRSTTGKVAPEVAEAIRAIFGGVRGGEPIQDLIADMANVNDELKKVLSNRPDINAFYDEFKQREKDLDIQVEKYHNLNKIIGQTFIEGLVGGKDFADSLSKINTILTDLQKNARNFGDSIKDTLEIFGKEGLTGVVIDTTVKLVASMDKQATADIIQANLEYALKQGNTKFALDALLEAQTLGIDVKIGDIGLEDSIKALRQELLPTIKEIEFINSSGVNIEEQKTNFILQQKEYLSLESNIRKELQASGATELEIEQKLAEVRKLSGKFIDKELTLQQELIKHLERIQSIELQREKQKGFIDNQLEALRLQGATQTQLIQASIEYEKQAGINQDVNFLLQKQIELEKAITAEKIKQTSFSSDAIKLYKIAQTEGIQTAQVFADFLQGKVPITAFDPSGALSGLRKILDEFFASEAEQARAFQFLTKGAGRGINFPEIQLRDLAEQGAVPTPAITPTINANVGGITVNVQKLIDKTTSAQEILEIMLDAIRANPELKQGFEEIIEEY